MAATLGGTPVAVKKLNNQNVGADLMEDMRRDVQKFHEIQVRAREKNERGGGRSRQGRRGRGVSGWCGVFRLRGGRYNVRKCWVGFAWGKEKQSNRIEWKGKDIWFWWGLA